MNGVLTFTQWTRSIRLNEHVQLAKRYLIKRYVEDHNIDNITPEVEQKALNIPAYDKIRTIVRPNDGYVFPFVKFHFDHNASLEKLTLLYQLIKNNAGSLNTLPMTIEEYSNQESVHGLNPIEALLDALRKIERRRKYRWVVDKVNSTLSKNIKASLDEIELDRLYTAAELIDVADQKAGTTQEDEKAGNIPANSKSFRSTVLSASSRYTDPRIYLEYIEGFAEGASNIDIQEIVNKLDDAGPGAGLLYLKNKRLVMSTRTAQAQKEVCSIVSNWCINDWAWPSYAGKHPDALQINIFDFNLSVTDAMFVTGTTIDEHGRVYSSSDKNNRPGESIKKSNDPVQHFALLGYPNDLIQVIMKSMPTEIAIKRIITELKIETSDPLDLLLMLVKSSYDVDLDVAQNVQDVVISIIKDQLSKKLSRSAILELFYKYGVLSTFSARILNILIPDLTDSERTELLNANDKIFNDMRSIIRLNGPKLFPKIVDRLNHEEQIKNIINSGESITNIQN